jgi:RNA polymerase sigma-70 factor (ECF subfamily)
MAEGDVESFGVLVERHQERLVRLCERMLGDSEDARDAAQDIFLKAWNRASLYRPQGRVFTWLYRIAVNHCLNQLRRRKVVRFLSFGELGKGQDHGENHRIDFDPEDEGPNPARRLESRQRWHATRRSIEELPTGQRAVLVLTKFEGLSYRQTAQVLEITEGAVESRLFRAMQNILRAQEKQK